jgi:hypothetical protein
MKLTSTASIILLIFFSSILSAQEVVTAKKDTAAIEPEPKGNVEIIQDSRIDSIVKMHVAYNKSQDGIMGFRVQIFFDAGNNSLERAEAVALEYQTLFPTDTAYISFTEPYYKVRVGDFRTRLEAEGFMQKILADYPNAFVIKDRIRFPEL